MGTRNLTMVINKQGETKVAQYGQWDGYPSGQGITILKFATNKDKVEKLKKELDNIKFIEYDENGYPSGELTNYLNEYSNRIEDWKNETNPKTKQDKFWFKSLLTRDLGGEILDNIISINKENLPQEMNAKIYLKNEIDFLNDYCCEYAYCINFQTHKLEIYTIGNNKIKEYDLDNLPKEKQFLKDLKEY